VSDRLEIELHNRAQAWVVIQAQLFPFLKDQLQAGSRWVLKIERRKRTKPQNRRYWGNGVLAQIAAQATVNGRMFHAKVWHEMFKRMFVGVIELPNGDVSGKSTAELTTVEFAEFCDRVEAYAATELGVTFYDLQPHHRDIETRRPVRRIDEEVAA
jgi:hypothetical protein